jgi:uncharacterized membrane protein YgdD (TMEM256/DUF423 family)
MNNIQVGALFCFLSVALGAFGSHGLKGKVTQERLDVWEIGKRHPHSI